MNELSRRGEELPQRAAFDENLTHYKRHIYESYPERDAGVYAPAV